MESLLLSEIDPTSTSQTLANNVLTALANQPPAYVSRPFLAAETYWLNGSELSRSLAIEEPSAFYKLLVLGNCLFFMTMSYSHRVMPWLDEMRIRRLRKTLYDFTVHNKKLGAMGKETNFEFQYVPTLDMIATHMGSSDEAEQWSDLRKAARTYEVRTVLTLALVTSAVGAGGYAGLKGVSRLVQEYYLKGRR